MGRRILASQSATVEVSAATDSVSASFRVPFGLSNQRDIASWSNPQIHQRIAPVISGNSWPQNVGINLSLAGNLVDQVANYLNSSSAAT